ncbi:MAG TPA: adenylate/guanylate cyclase domain-containing protein [Bryobacteraceae bacterium]|nr:adenylate/guanylate cyclase domain-containing protein [Bryobacteraceae bacterium]
MQDRRGVLYFANNDCVLEHDGVSWRKIPIPGGSVVRSVATDGTRVYAGAQGEFGYLDPDEHGRAVYHSLTSLVPKDALKFTDVWSIVANKSGVYFGTYQGIYRWSGDTKIRVWKPPSRFGRLLGANDQVFVVSAGQGLQRMQGDRLEPVPGGEHIGPLEARAVFDRGHGMALATDKGLFRLAAGGLEQQPLPEGIIGGGNTIYAAAPLWNGSIALGTRLGGIVVLGSNGAAERIIGKENGLLGNGIKSLYEDREGGLWITSAAGIDRADLAMTKYSVGEGLSGATYTVARHGKALYAGTDQGLFLLGQSESGIASFSGVEGIKTAVYVSVPSAHGLLVGFLGGLRSLDESGVRTITETQVVYDIATSTTDLSLAYVAGRAGLLSIRWNGSMWKPEQSFPSGGEDFRSVQEDADRRVWVATQKDILRVDWRAAKGMVERFGPAAGVPTGFKNIYRIRGEIVFATSKGLLQFDAAVSKFVPWTRLGKEFADGSHPVSIVRESPDGRVWITGEGYHMELRPKPQGGWESHPMPLGRADMTELYAILPEGDGTVWAAGTDGFLARYSPKEQPAPAPFQVLVRRIQAQSGFVAYDGAGASGATPQLGHRDNSLRFEFAAPFLEDPGKVEYQVRLDGADSDWSNWSLETQKDYTHLWEGGYRFLVRARNPSGLVSQPATFGFAIGAPWFRTWPAYVLYALMAMASVWGLLKWRVSTLEAEKAKLEQTVEERTVEIRQQRDQIALEEEKSQSLLLNILPESVASELKQTGTVQPQHYDDVTVCFTDFAGFTLSSEELPAEHLVSALHEYFTTFDEIVEEFGLEKLKTIGDSYMLVSGLPKPRPAHAVDAVLAALRMAEAVDDLAERGEGPVWRVRIGLHSGPVAAGVVGVRKFAFDIWGNTVNLASRMESSGAPGRVNLSETTFHMVSDFIECEERGEIQTKDKRGLLMYFAVGLRPELTAPDAFERLYSDRFGERPRYAVPSRRAARASQMVII